MSDPGDREAGFYWISIKGQVPEVAQWQTEWEQWLVTGSLQPLVDDLPLEIVVLSDMLPAPASNTRSTSTRSPLA